MMMRWEIYKNITKATYWITDAQISATEGPLGYVEWYVWRRRVGAHLKYYPRETSPLILMLVQITNKCSVLYLICKHSSETNIIKHCDEAQQMVQWQSEAKTQENIKQDHGESDHRHRQSASDHLKLKQIEKGSRHLDWRSTPHRPPPPLTHTHTHIHVGCNVIKEKSKDITHKWFNKQKGGQWSGIY